MIDIKCFVFGPFMENTYVLHDSTHECIVIDPGCYLPEEQQALTSFISEKKLQVQLIVNTHCHIDHVLGNRFVKDQYNVKLLIHKKEEEILKAVKVYAPNYGFPLYQEADVDQYIDEGDKITFGESELDVLLVPGHSPGHIALFCTSQNFCIGGDVLFKSSIGRTDLPGGNHQQLIDSIQQKVFSLGDSMKIYSGHGPATDIGTEKKSNPFVRL